MRDGDDDGKVDRGDGVRIPAWEADKHPATCGFCLGSGEAEAEGKCGECAECHGFGMLNPDGSPCPPKDPPLSCPHGSLARSCEVCELQREVVENAHGWALAEVERDEARAHARDHHLEACVSCAATESQRDAALALLGKVRTGEHFSEHTPGNCSVCSDIDKALSGGMGEA